MNKLTLISSPTYPFVQRANIALREKAVDFDVVYIDLANKPDWFVAASPLGKVPLLKIERPGETDVVIFESAVILEYLEETAEGRRLHPADALERAQHRSWIEFGSTVLADLWNLSVARDDAALATANQALTVKFKRLEATVVGPFFAGETFSNVDAVFAPAFRQLDVLETVVSSRLLDGCPKLSAWRAALAARPSVRQAVPADYADQYLARLRKDDAAVLKRAA